METDFYGAEDGTLDGLVKMLALHRPNTTIHFPTGNCRVTVAELDAAANGYAADLLAKGTNVGEVIGIVATSSPQTLAALIGILRAGACATLIPAPTLETAQQVPRHLAGILATTNMRTIVLGSAEVAWKLPQRMRVVSKVEPSILPRTLPDPDPERIAIVQFTSGSTGRPRGVQLSHRAVLAGLQAISASAAMTPKDILVQWIPLYHDMGLFGLLAQVLNGGDAHVFSPFAFLRHPHDLLRYFAEQRATLMTGPDFGYVHLLDAARSLGSDLDLSSWRLAFNGAEFVRPETVTRFATELARFGVGANVMFPVYGMAEATLAITFTAPGTVPTTIDVPRDLRVGQTIETEPIKRRRLVGVGRPVTGMEIKICDLDGRQLPPSTMGEIWAHGASIMSGYLGDPEATSQVFQQGWLKTGDLGLLHDSDLYIAGRQKEMIVVHGTNFFPEDVEAIARQVPGVHRQRCIAFADRDNDDRELIGVIVEAQSSADHGLAERVRLAVAADLALGAVRVHVVPPRWLTRTTSGKWQRIPSGRRLNTSATPGGLADD